VRLEEIKKVINDYKKILTEQYRVKSIGVFGSYATDIPTSESDIDILVEFSDPPDIFEFIRLENFLTEILGVKVDLVTKKALKPILKEKILAQTIYL